MTAKIHIFETPKMAGDRTQRELRACETEVAGNCLARLAQKDMNYRTRIENELALAIATGDLDKSKEIADRLERLNLTGMKLVE